jgi:hypothetical protein
VVASADALSLDGLERVGLAEDAIDRAAGFVLEQRLAVA